MHHHDRTEHLQFNRYVNKFSIENIHQRKLFLKHDNTLLVFQNGSQTFHIRKHVLLRE
jgi:hypothetical protein